MAKGGLEPVCNDDGTQHRNTEEYARMMEAL